MKPFNTAIVILILIISLIGTAEAVKNLRSNRKGKSHNKTPDKKKKLDHIEISSKNAISEPKKNLTNALFDDYEAGETNEKPELYNQRLATGSTLRKLKQDSTNSSANASNSSSIDAAASSSSSGATASSQGASSSPAGAPADTNSTLSSDFSVHDSNKSANSHSAGINNESAVNKSNLSFEDVIMVPKISAYAREDLIAMGRNEELKALGGGALPTYLISDKVFDETPLIYVDVLRTKITGAGRPSDDRKIDHLWAGWLGDRLYKNVSFDDLDLPAGEKINAEVDEALKALKKKIMSQASNSSSLKPDLVLDDIVNPIKKNMFETHSNTTLSYNDLIKNLTKTQKEAFDTIENPKK